MPMIARERSPVSRGPRRPIASELKRVGVVIVSNDPFTLECMSCGQRWWPCTRGGGGAFPGYWKCPEDCNADAVQPRNAVEGTA